MLEMLTTFDEEVYLKGIREEGREEGREEIIIKAYNNGNSPEQIAMFTGIPLSEVQQIIDSHKSQNILQIRKIKFKILQKNSF